MAHLTFRVSDQLASRFEAAAARRGGKSRLLRHLVESVTGPDAVGPDHAGAGEGTSRTPSDKLTLRLRRDDLAQLAETSRLAGMRRTEWAAACLRRQLLAKPQFNKAQEEALLEARRDLRRISAQLRELLYAVRDGDLPADQVTTRLDEISGFQQAVRSQLEGLRGALEGEAAYWESPS